MTWPDTLKQVIRHEVQTATKLVASLINREREAGRADDDEDRMSPPPPLRATLRGGRGLPCFA